jgi:hypothetical protein
MMLDDVVPHPQYRMCHSRTVSAARGGVGGTVPSDHVGPALGVCAGGRAATACPARWQEAPALDRTHLLTSRPFRSCSPSDRRP